MAAEDGERKGKSKEADADHTLLQENQLDQLAQLADEIGKSG